jgi:hypothetical protein
MNTKQPFRLKLVHSQDRTAEKMIQEAKACLQELLWIDDSIHDHFNHYKSKNHEDHKQRKRDHQSRS